MEKVIQRLKDLKVHLYVATPAYGCRLTSRYALSLLKLQAVCIVNGIELSIDFMGNESLITRGRSILASRFLKSAATHLLFIDADIGFDPQTILRMAAFDKDIVCGAYAKKAFNWDVIKQKIEAGETNEAIMSMGLDYNININEQYQVTDGFIKVYDAATGMMLIRKAALSKVADTYAKELRVLNDIPVSRDKDPEYVAIFDTEICPDSRRFLSEDYAFCRKAQRCGLEVWLDLTATLSHTGTNLFVGDIMQRCKVQYMR